MAQGGKVAQGCQDPHNNRFYTLHGRQEVEEAPDVVTVMLQVFNFDVYVLLDPGANLSFVSLYIAMKFSIDPEILLEPYSVYNPVGESIVASRVFRGCPISILKRVIPCDLVELEMVDFDIILGMDWLHSAYANIDCRTREVKFQIPSEPFLKWKGSDVVVKGRFISCLKAQN